MFSLKLNLDVTYSKKNEANNNNKSIGSYLGEICPTNSFNKIIHAKLLLNNGSIGKRTLCMCVSSVG